MSTNNICSRFCCVSTLLTFFSSKLSTFLSSFWYSHFMPKSLIFGLSWAYFLSLDLQARIKFELNCCLCVLWHVSTSDNALLFGCDSLYIGPHINFSDCVLNFIFFMCSLVVTMEIHYY